MGSTDDRTVEPRAGLGARPSALTAAADSDGHKSVFVVASAYSDNVGDNAILESLLHEIRASGPARVSVLSVCGRQRDLLRPDGITVRPVNPINPLSMMHHLQRCERVILGGGGIIQQASSIYNLYYFLAVGILALVFGRQIDIRAIGVEEVRSAMAKRVISLLVRKAASVTVRDQASLDRLVAIAGEHREVQVERDLAFSRPYDELAVRRRARENAEKPYILVSLRPPLVRSPLSIAARKYTPTRLEQLAGDVAPGLQLVFDELANTLGDCRLVFLSCQYPRDHEFAERLLGRLKLHQEIAVVRGLVSFDEMLFLSKDCSCMLASRYHACLAALRVDAPLIAVGNLKIDALIQEHGTQKNTLLLDAVDLHRPSGTRMHVRRFLQSLPG